MFVDKATVQVRAGKGGDGAVSFRHEKYVDRGGPDGGDGGDGGDVIFVADKDQNTLLSFRYKQELAAENGQAGGKRKMHGKNGAELIVNVPVGTVILGDDGQKVADFIEDGQKVIIAKGGKGGFGNAHFISSVRQAPRVAELGEKGDEYELKLELKLLADVGLIGLPNAGKSTFLSVVTNARPEIADYPFTTLTPNLGVAAIDENALLLADIPGLIEGASEGKGLGDEFLRHVERTAVLVHLIDVYNEDVAKVYGIIRQELAAYSPALVERPEIVALTKIEHLDEEIVADQKAKLQAIVGEDKPVFAISSLTKAGVKEVLREAYKAVKNSRQAAESAEAEAQAEKAPSKIPIIELSARAQDRAWRVEKQGDIFMVSGSKIQRFAARTNFATEEGVRRLRDIMRKMGIMHELERQGVKIGAQIAIRGVDQKLSY